SRNYLYVGLSDNVERRLKEHNSGKNRTTRPYRPFRLIHMESLNSRSERSEERRVGKEGQWRQARNSEIKNKDRILPGWRNLHDGRQVGCRGRCIMCMQYAANPGTTYTLVLATM